VDKKMTRVLVFALDGCAYSMFNLLKDQSPFFKEIAENSRYGEMTTVAPATTSMGWPAFYTGKNSGKTGNFRRERGSGLLKAFSQSRNGVDGDALWDILTREGMKSAVFNMPFTYPAKELNGILISSFDSGDDWIYPKHLKEKVTEHWVPQEDPPEDKDAMFTYWWKRIEAEHGVASALLEGGNWDLGIITFLELDRIQHKLMNSDDPLDHIMVIEIYKKIARACMDLWEQHRDAEVVVVCDHGMRPTNAAFHLNSYFWKEGWLKIEPIAEKILNNYTDGKSPIARAAIFEDSIAWSPGFGAIVLEDQSIRGEIISFLKEYTDPLHERPVFDDVLPREKVWSGKYLDQMPDLIAMPAPGYEVHRTDIAPSLMESHKYYTDHDLKNGLYAISGLSPEEKPAHLLDIAPTILKMLGVKVPNDFDRRGLK